VNLSISQIVLERAEFAHREDYLRLEQKTALPPSSVEMTVQVQRAEGNTKGAALVRVIASSGEDAVYHFAVTYVVFYGMVWEGDESVPDDLDRRLMVTGATMLFPFLRETVANLTSRGRFGPSWLTPTNFNSLVPTPTAPEALASASQ
jgi:preprotein translocase subunit SecB